MKREALIRDLTAYARKHNLSFKVDKVGGKGSHYRVTLGDETTTVQSCELSPFLVRRIRKQLKVNPA